jgi:flavin-dependent dehydrogenase
MRAHYDVLIIGAGPGGCMAARTLSDAGFRVLVTEKDRIPRDKPCGGFLPPEAVRLIEDSFGPIPDDCGARPGVIRGARLLCEEGGTYELPFSGAGHSVLRSRLDAFLSAGCGAEVLDGCVVEGFLMQRFNVRAHLNREGEEEDVESTYLIGADGADSLALRLLRPEFHRLYAVPKLERTMLVLCAGEMEWDPEWMGFALLRRGMGLARFFIKEDLIGLAVNHDASKGWREGMDGLTAFLKEKVGLRLREEPIRQATSSNRMAAEGHYNLGAGCALLVGEAAGLLDPWGFGIHLALESGYIAADTLIESAGESITPHLRYRYRMQEVLEREMKQRRNIAAMVGDLDTSSLAGDRTSAARGTGSRTARRDRRALRRRFTK